MKSIKVQIDSCNPQEELRLEDFLIELNAIKKAMDALCKNYDDSIKVGYKLLALKKQSPAEAEILPFNEMQPDDELDEEVSAFYSVIQNPQTLNPELYSHFAEIGKTTKRNNLVFLSGDNLRVELKESFGKVADKTQGYTTQISFITGRLEALNFHNEEKIISIYPIYGNSKVRGIVPKELIPIVEKAVNKKITVIGKTKTRLNELYPYEIVASDIKILKTRNEIPSPDEMWGISENKTGISPEEFLKNLRND